MKFTQEHEEIRRTMKKFIDAEINPHVDAWEEAEQFPAHEVFKKLGDLGMLGLTKPEAYGGTGLDWSYAMVMAESLGHIRCGGVPMAIGVQTDGSPVHRWQVSTWHCAEHPSNPSASPSSHDCVRPMRPFPQTANCRPQTPGAWFGCTLGPVG